MVLRVDKEKGYIDLSKRRVAAEDIQACEDRWNKSKMVHSIMRHLAESTGRELEDLYKIVGWPLYRAYGHAFEAFKVLAAPGAAAACRALAHVGCCCRLQVSPLTLSQGTAGLGLSQLQLQAVRDSCAPAASH